MQFFKKCNMIRAFIKLSWCLCWKCICVNGSISGYCILLNLSIFLLLCQGNTLDYFNFISLKFPLCKSYTPDHFQDLVIGYSKSCIFSYKFQNQLCNIYPIKSYKEFKNCIKSADQFCYCFHRKFYQELFEMHSYFIQANKAQIGNTQCQPKSSEETRSVWNFQRE